jgi:glucokinase
MSIAKPVRTYVNSPPRDDIENRRAMRLGAGLDGEARSAAHLRRLNMERILAVAMDRATPFTRAELIQATRLSAPTVGNLVSHLIKSGVVRDLGTGPSRGGRRPSFMEFNARHGFVAAIDLGPTKTRLAVADLRGEQLAHRVLPTPAGLGPTALLARLATSVKSLMREADIPGDRLLAVGAGAPGAVDTIQGIVELAPNLKGWSRVPMAATLSRALRTSVVVENDVNLAVLGERWRGAARGHDDCAFIHMGTGIGAGIIVKGELYHGHHFQAGEIAFMCMGAQYVDVDFGARGCLETLAGLKAIAARWPGSNKGTGESWVIDLHEAALAGDKQARKAVEDTARLIGIAAANLRLVLDPSLIVLGGALVTLGDAFLQEVRQTVAHIVPAPTEIVASALDKEAPLWGSLLVATIAARQRLRQRLREARASA